MTIACPHCGQTEGFLLDLDGVSYKVLEDNQDTELLEEAAQSGIEQITCFSCKTTITVSDETILLETGHAVSLTEGVPRKMGPRRNRIHAGGSALWRETPEGARLPVCPECTATHHFFVDLDGAAYRVLEDDADTDLLEEAANLLCSRCHTVFDL